MQQPFLNIAAEVKWLEYKRCVAAIAAAAVSAGMLTSCGGESEQVSYGDELVKEAVKLYEEKDYNAALSVLQQAEHTELKNTDSVVMYYYLGESYFKTGDYEKSIEAHSKALESSPDMFKSWVTTGVCYRKLGDRKKALEAYERALEFDPVNGDSVGLYVSLGSVYISSGKPYTAIDYLEDAVSIYPEHAAAHAYLAIAYAMAFEYDRSDEELALAEALGYTQCDEIRARIKEIR